jgi:hypothetical protein
MEIRREVKVTPPPLSFNPDLLDHSWHAVEQTTVATGLRKTGLAHQSLPFPNLYAR